MSPLDFAGFLGPLLAKVAKHPKALPIEPLDDAELVFRMRHNDRWAEEAFYRRHVESLMALVVRLLGHRHDAEEVVQDTFLTAFEELSSLRDAGAARAWLRMIAVRKVHRRFRRRKLMRAIGLDRGLDEATLESLASPTASADTKAELAVVDRMLKRMPVEARTAWMLRYVDGERLEDVAKICNCSLATVKRRVALCDAHLESVLHAASSEGESAYA